MERIDPSTRDQARKNLHALHAFGISSYAQLASALPSLRGEALVPAIWALRHFDRRKSVPLLLNILDSPEPLVRGYALVGLEVIAAARSIPALLHHLRDDPDPWVREKAAHALGFLFDSRFDKLVFDPLLSSLENDNEQPAVRAQAAESLGNILAYSDRRTRRFKRAQQALIRALEHSAPEVRFWAAFALGSMRSRSALPKLRHLADIDVALCPGWWPVKDEASDAIECILTGSWPEHEREMHR